MHIFFKTVKTNNMSDEAVVALWLLISVDVILFLPIVFKMTVDIDVKNGIVVCEIKLFNCVKVLKLKVDAKNQKLIFFAPKEKEIGFNELDFKQPINLWAVKALRCIYADLTVDVDIYEFSKQPNLTVGGLGIAVVFGTVLKRLFNRAKTKINVNDQKTTITAKAVFFTSIFLFLKVFVKHVFKGEKDASTRLSSKSDRANSRVGNI